MASGCVTKIINNFFKKIFLVFSIILGKGSSVFLKFNIEKLILALVVLKVVGIGGLIYIGLIGLGGFYGEVFR